ncbi:MAG TPA: penicillin-binding protein 2 [Longimicrobiales bacterium]
MQLFHLHARRRRAQGALAVLVLGLGTLGFAFFETQVLHNDVYALQSDANRLRPLPIPAPRGAIFDRNGEILADNVPGYALSLLPASEDTIRAALERLKPLLKLTPEAIDALLAKRREAPGQPLVVSSDLTFEQVSAIEERRPLLPGVYIDMRPKRRYLAGAAAAHVLGYVGEISESELELPEFEGYSAGQIVGKAGVERQYERRLGGRPGVRYVEVDAHGRIVGEYAPRRVVPPVPGEDLRLHLDLDLQRWIARIFPDSMRGAIVAVEPGTGHVLALFSNPSFDPNLFVGGVDPAVWKRLNEDPATPLLNRATSGTYPPGSTFKLVTAAIALKLGVLDPEAYLPIPCRGGMQYGNRYFRCWEREGHGYVNLPDAIKVSCDVYFYQVGLKIGLERFLAEGTRLGFAQRSGIDVPEERAGTFPDGPRWYRRRWGWEPTQAEVLSLAIGQGANDQSPLRMAQLYAALASDGRVAAPRVADGGAAEGEGWDLGLTEAILAPLREGIRRVTLPDSGGTAGLSALEHWDWRGKTGTAQNAHGKDHAWFVGMAGPRGGEPEIVVAALLEFGEHGWVAAQYAAKTADYYLRRKHGMPTDTVQTLRDHYLAGRPARWAQ